MQYDGQTLVICPHCQDVDRRISAVAGFGGGVLEPCTHRTAPDGGDGQPTTDPAHRLSF